MEMTDYKEFCIEWKKCFFMLNRPQDVPDKTTLDEIFKTLSVYPFGAVKSALYEHRLKNKFPPTAPDIYENIQKKIGEGKEQLKNAGYIFYDKYLQKISGEDAVINDWRMAKAFAGSFRSVADFLNRPNDTFNVSKDRETFAKAVENTLVYNQDINLIPRVFKGTRRFKSTIRVVFFGDFQECKAYAQRYYATTKEDQQYLIEYPIDPALRIENKQTEDKEEMSREQKLDNMENPIKELEEIVLKFDPKYKTKKKK